MMNNIVRKSPEKLSQGFFFWANRSRELQRTERRLEQKEEKDTMEMIEKALHEELVQKAVQEALEPIQKALKDAEEKLAAYEQEKIEAVEKSRKDALAAAMGADNPELEKMYYNIGTFMWFKKSK